MQINKITTARKPDAPTPPPARRATTGDLNGWSDARRPRSGQLLSGVTKWCGGETGTGSFHVKSPKKIPDPL